MGLPALFFAPHQDDETLIFGVEIGRHVTAGRPVTVICAGDGTKTGALGVLNGASPCGYHGYTHNPAAEGRTTMVGSDLTAYRTVEQHSAAAALRVSTYVPGIDPEDGLTVQVWRDLLLAHEYRTTGGASVFVCTPWETTGGVGNPDHGNAGLAMQQLRAEGHYSDAAGVWVAYGVFSRYWTSPGCPAGITRGPGTAEERARLLAAADTYRAFNPQQGSLAIGWSHSVPADFQEQFVNTASSRYLMGRYHT
jgi:LmbE family N-acetylglucosaminyl deacetylase